MNSQYLHDLMRSHPQLGVAENMLNAGKWADGEHELWISRSRVQTP